MAKGIIVYEPETKIIEKGDVAPLVQHTGNLFIKMGGFFAITFYSFSILFLSIFNFKNKVREFQMRKAKIIDLTKK